MRSSLPFSFYLFNTPSAAAKTKQSPPCAQILQPDPLENLSRACTRTHDLTTKHRQVGYRRGARRFGAEGGEDQPQAELEPPQKLTAVTATAATKTAKKVWDQTPRQTLTWTLWSWRPRRPPEPPFPRLPAPLVAERPRHWEPGRLDEREKT